MLPISLLPESLQSAASFDFSALTLLAVLQGLTEFLPISSSGHLVLAQAAMRVDHPALALDVALHVGTLLAVVIVYRRDLLQLLRDVRAGELRETLLLALATLPAAVLGVAFKDKVQSAFHAPQTAAWGLFVTALVLLVGEWARRRAKPSDVEHDAPMTWKQALVIGLLQALAIFPGISRSGSTIAAGLVCGLSPTRAARFSFLMAIPAILGAAVLNLPEAIEEGVGGSPAHVVWAVGLAGFVGWGALRVLLAFLGRGAFAWFAVYCVALGSGALLFG